MSRRRGYLGGDEIREKGDNIVYQYDREERKAQRIAQTGELPRKGWLRGNKSLIITLIDVVIVIGVFLLYIFFLKPMADRQILGDYTIRGQAFQYADRVFVSLSIVAEDEPRETEDDSSGLITVVTPSGEISDLLPAEGRERIIRFDEEWDGSSDLPLTFRIGEMEGTLSISVSLEGEQIDGE